MYPEGLTVKKMLWARQDVSHIGCAFRAQVCFRPSCSAGVCDCSCTGKERLRPALLMLAREHRGWLRLVKTIQFGIFPSGLVHDLYS